MGEEGNPCDMNALGQELASIRELQQKCLESNVNVNAKLDYFYNAFQPLAQQVAGHPKTVKYLDQDKRRKNLIIFGLEESEDETFRQLDNKVLGLIVNKLQVNDFTLAELDFSRRQGKRNPGKGPRPVLIAFTTQRRKFDILKSKGKLKGTYIFIYEDTSPEVREQEKQLLGEMKRLRLEGKYAVVRSGRLIVHDSRGAAHPHTTGNKRARALSQSPQTENTNKRVNMGSSESLFHSQDVNIMSSEQINNHFPISQHVSTGTYFGSGVAPTPSLAAEPHTRIRSSSLLIPDLASYSGGAASRSTTPVLTQQKMQQYLNNEQDPKNV